MLRTRIMHHLRTFLSRSIRNINAGAYPFNGDKTLTNVPSNFALQARHINLISVLSKYYKKHSPDEDQSDDEYDSEFKDERDSKVLRTKVNSLRADLLLRAGLGISRNKIEVIFYESKIRVNGKKPLKKSLQLNVDDEIDIIKGFSQSNPTHLIVARVIVLDSKEIGDGLSVTLRRYKSLLIDNYSGINTFRSSAAD